MMRPPAVFFMAVKKRGTRGFRIWLPVFVFWPLMLAAMVLFAPIVLLWSLSAAMRRKRPSALLFAPRVYALICATRGLNMQVESEDETVRIYVI